MNPSKKKYVKYGNMLVSEKEAEQIALHPKRNLLLLLLVAALMAFVIPIIAIISLIVGVILYLIAPGYQKALDGPRYTQTGEPWRG